MKSDQAVDGDRVDILLATYNGERFLAEQLDSIIAQTHQNWRILARDDGSSDGTVAMLRAYRGRLGLILNCVNCVFLSGYGAREVASSVVPRAGKLLSRARTRQIAQRRGHKMGTPGGY